MTIRQLRIMNGMSQEDLAKASGVKTSTIIQLDRGNSIPELMTFKTACQLAKGFSMTVDELARKLNVK